MASPTHLAPAQVAMLDYSRRFLETLDANHAAASPLGAWALLALLAHGAPPGVRNELEHALGCDADEAFNYVRELCEQKHPAISVGLGAWIHEDAFTPLWAEFVASLPQGVDGGAMPTPEVADAWMRKATRGRISKMPVRTEKDSAALLASALAMDGGWQRVLDVSFPGALGPHEFEGNFERVLLQFTPHNSLVDTESAGLVGASVLETDAAFVVVSVVAPQEVSRDQAIRAAHEVASQWQRFTHESNVSLFDLPLGDGPDWSIEEAQYKSFKEDDRRESSTILIPAWEITEARTDLLSNAQFGFLPACPALERLLKPREFPYVFEAAQIATARFHQLGFSAAAGTAFMATRGASMFPTHLGRERQLTLSFRRPYAVVVMARSPRELMHRKGIAFRPPTGPHPWADVPVFAAWVTRPTEPELAHEELGMHEYPFRRA